jgi:zinc transport system ATP-binding protein
VSVKVIEAKDVSVQYQGVEALSRISFDIQSGDYIGIVGPNGSGKTTLVKALLGLVSFEGTIRFLGESLSDFTTTKHIGYLPQKMSFLDQRFPATAEEIVVSGVYCCKKFPKRLSKSDHKAAAEAMGILGVTDLKDRPIGRLSGGQQQRILLARALVHRPQLLILDEPTVALDPRSRGSFYETVKKLNKESGVTVLLVSHDVGSVGLYASKLLYLDREIIFYGTFEDFCRSPKMSDYFGAGQHVICHRH